jgi:hypothetical protein
MLRTAAALTRSLLVKKHAAQHAGAGERDVQMQLIDPSHQHQVGVGYRARQVVHVRAREIQQLGLPLHR